MRWSGKRAAGCLFYLSSYNSCWVLLVSSSSDCWCCLFLGSSNAFVWIMVISSSPALIGRTPSRVEWPLCPAARDCLSPDGRLHLSCATADARHRTEYEATSESCQQQVRRIPRAGYIVPLPPGIGAQPSGCRSAKFQASAGTCRDRTVIRRFCSLKAALLYHGRRSAQMVAVTRCSHSVRTRSISSENRSQPEAGLACGIR